MEFNNALMGFPMPTMRNFQSKAEALQFAIEFTASASMDGRKVDLEDAIAYSLKNLVQYVR
jgi:hypothetical protein